MPVGILLLVLGLTGLAGGGWVALNIRGAAVSLNQRQERNIELRAHAQGRLDPPAAWFGVTGFRVLAAVVAAAGSVLALLSFAVIATA
ncbi:hypothetical protein [Streptomyces sp. NPDC051211]|uniref:hypothetical protein n=1 Tax=Streptomyces sp. NPDC051211 TaxID=3154643 RepID=UPI0034500AC1